MFIVYDSLRLYDSFTVQSTVLTPRPRELQYKYSSAVLSALVVALLYLFFQSVTFSQSCQFAKQIVSITPGAAHTPSLLRRILVRARDVLVRGIGELGGAVVVRREGRREKGVNNSRGRERDRETTWRCPGEG